MTILSKADTLAMKLAKLTEKPQAQLRALKGKTQLVVVAGGMLVFADTFVSTEDALDFYEVSVEMAHWF